MQSKWISNLSQFTKQNSPTILSAVAVGGVVATAILAVRATPKAMKRIEEGKLYRIAEEKEKTGPFVTKMEIVKEVWPYYIPAALSGATTIACIIGSNSIGAKRYAALGAAYTVLDTTFRDYKEHVIKEIGEAKNRKIEDQAMEDQVTTEKVETIIMAGGDQLCYESLSGRYFKSDIEKIRRAENDLNAQIINGDMCASLNEWYDLLGLEHTDMGDEVGWSIKTRLECVFASHLNACSGEPALSIRYKNFPSREYTRDW